MLQRAWCGGRSRRTSACTCQDVADGEFGAAATVDELAHVRARTFADGELGAATAVVLVIKLGRNCN